MAHLRRFIQTDPESFPLVKRNEALRQLSRDHHRALEAALKLRRATDGEAAQAAREFQAFWREHGALHFRVEEDVLLPGAAGRVDPTDPAVVRVLTDHVQIRRMAADLEDGETPDTAQLNALGELLSDHVRHEERVLFPAIEEALTDEELARLAQRIEEAERSG
jgi:hemerythrin-like domain-containing protein